MLNGYLQRIITEKSHQTCLIAKAITDELGCPCEASGGVKFQPAWKVSVECFTATGQKGNNTRRSECNRPSLRAAIRPLAVLILVQ